MTKEHHKKSNQKNSENPTARRQKVYWFEFCDIENKQKSGDRSEHLRKFLKIFEKSFIS